MAVEERIIIHPKRGAREKILPRKGIFFVTPREAAHAHKILREAGGEARFLYNSQLTVSASQELFVAGPAVGAPMAAMTLEKLIANGAAEVIMYGWCGSTQPRLPVASLLAAEMAFSGEGVSQYYALGAACCASDAALVCSVQKFLDGLALPWTSGAVWTTDAPYREDRNYIQQLVVEHDVVAVDMEYSALCSVALFRKIKFAALLIVSDALFADVWKPGFRDARFKSRNRTLVRELCQWR